MNKTDQSRIEPLKSTWLYVFCRLTEEILLCDVLELITVFFLHKGFMWFDSLPGTLISIEMVVWHTFVLPIYQTKMPPKFSSSIRRQKLLLSYDRSAILWQICHKTGVGLYWVLSEPILCVYLCNNLTIAWLDNRW